MKLVWKLIIAIAVIFIIGFSAAVYWGYNKMTSITVLKITEGDSQSQKIAKANTWLKKLQKDDKFNGAVLLIKNDSVLLKNTYGFTNALRKEKLTNNSSFRLASVSKQFTAVGIMILKDQGKLSFNDTITKFLPELKYNTVTVRNLLQHTSGVPDVYMDFPKKYANEIEDYLTISKVINLLRKENLPLKHKPNEKYMYNNTGYVLLAGIIEKVSGKSFEEFMQTELFDKLNMKNTRVWNLVSTTKDFTNKTSSFENILGEVIELKPGVIDGVAGDGAVFSSINDFVLWNKFWYENEIISEETKNEAFKKPVLNNGKESNYGFGWIIINKNTHWHNGSWLGARTTIIRNKKLKNCIVILDNSASMNINKIANELAKVLK